MDEINVCPNCDIESSTYLRHNCPGCKTTLYVRTENLHDKSGFVFDSIKEEWIPVKNID